MSIEKGKSLEALPFSVLQLGHQVFLRTDSRSLYKLDIEASLRGIGDIGEEKVVAATVNRRALVPPQGELRVGSLDTVFQLVGSGKRNPNHPDMIEITHGQFALGQLAVMSAHDGTRSFNVTTSRLREIYLLEGDVTDFDFTARPGYVEDLDPTDPDPNV